MEGVEGPLTQPGIPSELLGYDLVSICGSESDNRIRKA